MNKLKVGDRVTLIEEGVPEHFLRQSEGGWGHIVKSSDEWPRKVVNVKWDNGNLHAYPMRLLTTTIIRNTK